MSVMTIIGDNDEYQSYDHDCDDKKNYDINKVDEEEDYDDNDDDYDHDDN